MTAPPLDASRADRLVADGARMLLITLADNSGLVRAKGVPAGKMRSAVEKGVGLSPVFSVMCADNAIISSPHYGGPAGDMRLIPDLDAATCIDPDAGLWWAPVDQRSQALEELPSCQRAALRRQCADAKAAGVTYQMAFELEFTLLSGPREDPSFAHNGPAYGLLAFVETEAFLLDLVDQFELAGLDPELVHPEYGPGQIEISMAAADPLTAADRHVLARLIVHRVATKHGLRASFSPVTAPGAVGNGCHVHFSALVNGENVFVGDGPDAPGAIGGAMIGGLVEHLNATTALFAPNPLSYERLVPSHWAGAYACWGPENREAAVRYIPGTVSHRKSAANCEVKIADNTCNPYLVAAAIIAMTMRGVRDNASLPTAVTCDPNELDEAELSRLGVRRLPESLDPALRALEASALAREALGDELVDAFVAVRRHDMETFGSLSSAERLAALRWLF